MMMLMMMFYDDDVDVDGDDDDDILLVTGRPTYFSGWRFLQYMATGEKCLIYQNSCVSIVFGHIIMHYLSSMLMTRCKEIYEERGGTLTDKQLCAGGEPGKVGVADNLLLDAEIPQACKRKEEKKDVIKCALKI